MITLLKGWLIRLKIWWYSHTPGADHERFREYQRNQQRFLDERIDRCEAVTGPTRR